MQGGPSYGFSLVSFHLGNDKKNPASIAYGTVMFGVITHRGVQIHELVPAEVRQEQEGIPRHPTVLLPPFS